MRIKSISHLLMISAFAVAGLLFNVPKTAQAANPATINFQGKVVNPDGTNVADGTYTFVFRLYQNVNTGTYDPNALTCASDTNCWWEETDSLSVTSGVFQVSLGATCAFTSACNSGHSGISFNTQNSLSLTMKFNGDAQGFMKPLLAMQSVPYAYQADNASALGGLGAANFVQLAQGIQTDSSTANASIAINKTGGTADIVTFQRGGTSVFVLDTNGALTVTPNGSNIGTVIRQTSGAATSGNIFDIQGANGTSHFIQVAQTAANAGSISITSLGANAVTIDSGSGTVVFGATTTTIQKSGAAFTVDVSNGASNSTLNVSNSGGAGNVTLNLDAGGSYAVGGTAGTTASACSGGQFLTGTLSGGIVTSGSCGTPTAYSTVQDEGVALTQRSAINFTGAGVTCADNAGSTRTDCTIPGGSGGTFNTTYSTTSQASNTVAYSNSGGGALILQDASTPLGTLFTIQNSLATLKFLTVDDVSSVPHLRVYDGTSNSNYADVYYSSGVAHFSASTGTTQIGTGTGAVNITAGASSAVAITGNANSTFTTTSGYVRLDGPSGVQIGTPSSNDGSLVFNNHLGAGTATITLAANPSTSYIYQLPTGTVSSNSCLQSGTVSGTTVPLTFSSCGAGSGTALSVNGTGVGATGNLQNTTGTTSVAATTFTNTSGNITLTVAAAGSGTSGIVTATGTQTFDGTKVFTGAVQVQNASGISIGTSSTAGVLALFNGTNTVSIQGASSTTAYTITLPSAVATGAGQCLTSTGANGILQWLACGAGSTASVSLTPEFAGAVMTGDGANNTGTMTSDFCGNDGAGSFVDINTSVCNTSGDFHNYYSWTSTGANDYDIWVRWKAPSDFSSFSTVQFSSKKSATGDDVKLTIYTNAGAVCGTGTSMTNTASAWQNTSYTITGCAPAAGDTLIYDVHMAVAASGNTCQMGAINITYNRK